MAEPATETNLLKLACDKLKHAGKRITQPRIAIITAMLERGQPIGIEQLHAELEVGLCDLVTVYRCLAAFEEIGLVRRYYYHNGTSIYELNLTDAKHYHLVCKATRRVDQLDTQTSRKLRQAVETIETELRARGYQNVSHVVEFFAVAPAAGRTAAFA